MIPILNRSPNDKFNSVASIFDDRNGVTVEHVLGVVAVDLQNLISHLCTDTQTHRHADTKVHFTLLKVLLK